MRKSFFIQDAMHILGWSADKASAFFDIHTEAKCLEVLNKSKNKNK